MEGIKDKLLALKGPRGYTIKSLGLNVEAAEAGKTWLLLPERFRYDNFGPTYPLPGKPAELRRLACIPVPPGKTDSGCIYLRRCFNLWRQKAAKKGSLLNDLGRTAEKLQKDRKRVELEMEKLKQAAESAVEDVKARAAESVATLTDLFALGRKGLREQMESYLAGKELRGEEISHAAFRDCFRMVTQAVKGLGLPDGERKNAAESIVEQAAAALRATRATLDANPPQIIEKTDSSDGSETTH